MKYFFHLTLIWILQQFIYVYSKNLLIAREFLNSGDPVVGWTYTNKEQCQGQLIEANKMVYMLSSSQKSSSKTYTNLPNHYRFEIRIDFLVVDSPYGPVSFQVDGQTLASYNFYSPGSALTICGNQSTKDTYERVQYKRLHSSSSLTVTINHNLGSGSKLGITDLQLYLDTCHPFCKSCNGPDQNNCTGCASGQTLSAGTCTCPGSQLMQNGSCVSSCAPPQMASGNTCVDDPCQINCSACSASGPRQCTKCSGSNRLFNGNCIAQCPSFTDNINGVCIDMLQNYWNGYYLFKGFFEPDFSSISFENYGFTANYFDPSGIVPDSEMALYTDCYGIRVYAGFGIYGKNVQISNQWPIPWKHSSVLVKMKYVQVENYEFNGGVPEKLSINLNDQEEAFLINGGTDLGCGRLDQGESMGWLTANTTQTVQDGFLKLTITNNFGDPAWYEGYAFRELTIIVAKCVDNCTKCTDYDGCIQCDPGFYLYRAQCYANKCPDGSYQDKTKLPLLVCADCDNTCLTCSDSGPLKCVTCSTPPRLFKSNQCVVDCGNQFYPGTTKCLPCDSTCFNCSGPSSSQCTSCSSGRFYLVSTHQCLLNCPPGFYNDASKNVCSPCNAQCYTCQGPSANECLTCEPPKMFLTVNSCGPGCAAGYFGNTANQVCTPCQSPCQTCVNTATNCVTCVTNYYLQNGNKCLTTCNNRFFPNSVTNTCDPCNVLCVNCNGPNSNQCTSCDANTGFLQNSTCVSQCAIGTYGDTNTYTCKQCDTSCYACQAPGDSTSCTKCFAPNFLNNLGQCKPTCPNQFYGDKSNLVCKPCHPTCLQCTDGNSTSCTKCDVGRYLSSGQCLLKCPDGTYPDNVNQICNNCYYTCAQCTDSVSTACVTCQNGRFFYGGSCFLKCPDGYYNDIMSLSCKVCDSTCKTCAGPGNNMCLSCKSGKYLNNNFCVPTCLDGYYMDNNSNQCEICYATCKTCYGPLPDNCQTCAGNRYLDPINLTCVSYCPQSFFADLTNHKCISCDPSCLNCYGTLSDQCSECPNGTYLLDGKCYTVCKAGYFPVTQPNICSPCHKSCGTCTGALENQCFSCNSGRYQLGYVCLEQCPDNYYGESTSNQCKQCHSSCFLCNGGTNSSCTKCVIGMYLYNGTCVKICPTGYFGSDLKGKCLQCDPTCATCDKTNPSTCFSCINNFYLYQSKCLQQCPTGTFESTAVAQSQDPSSSQQIINICKNCYYGCKTCNGELDKSCLVWDTVEVYYQESKIIYWIFVGQSIYSTFAFFFGFYRDYKCKQQEDILEQAYEDREDAQPFNEISSPDNRQRDNLNITTNNSHIPMKNNFQRTQRRKRPNTIILQELNPQENNSPQITQQNTPYNNDENKHTLYDDKSSIHTIQLQSQSFSKNDSKLVKNGTLGTNQFVSFYQSNTNIPSIRKLQRQPTIGGTVKTAMIIPQNKKEKEGFEISGNKNLFFFYLNFFQILNILIRYDKYLIRPLRALIFYAKTMLILWFTSRLMPNQLYVVFSLVTLLQIIQCILSSFSRFISKNLPRAAAILFTLVVIVIMYKLFWFFLPELSIINYSQDRNWSFLYLYAISFDLGLFQLIFNGIQYFYTRDIIKRPPITWSKSKKAASKIFYNDSVAQWLKQLLWKNERKKMTMI
ncbi:hypothetical protein TTHERM_000194618 (macronuclear) [Tetrahymena thermophila SB210]|uniref:EGF-like domain-containing protein n=1 Tax=Tetrahymena thermophila (strain SB210) TaxID=312017 RepID=W7X464_TETTS|nr:hypothetical protein TTHERM_000194618 [Tetrahymena thermophila SB210]EWS74105.1 hypothetical protein TTHERM_000194618 [Tetrahymena thermophila SB210]|eukprot:XP_012653360.1 hypothetical protein TTHERM_000194618 [Tetrahymena thermophila SB210]